jgi:hypothetical protein
VPAREGTTGPKPNVAIGAPGGGDPGVPDATAVVVSMAPGFRNCYGRGLALDPLMKGALRLTLRIGPAGEVVSAQANGSSGLSQGVQACLVARAKAARFAAPPGGGAVLVIPLTFTSS